jgi:hypothetical protein
MATITITAWKPIGSETFANVAEYTNSVNDGVWLGFNDQCVRCTEYKLTTQYEQGNWYWQKVVSFLISETPYNPVKILDAGTFEKKYITGGGQKNAPILDGTGQPITSPVPLNGTGEALTPGDPYFYHEFIGYRKLDWAGIV